MFTAALFSLCVAAVPSQPKDTKSPPKRPAERFTVYVETAPRFASTSGESTESVLEKVSGKIKKRKGWLFLTEAPDKAEVRVQILGHRVREEHMTSISSRVRDRPRWDDQGPPVDYVDENYVSERHYLQAGVTVLGRVRVLAGHDGRKKGASLDRAAATLAENLEEYLKENYWDLTERRRQAAARGVDLPPPPEVSTPSPQSEPPDPTFATYLEAVESYRASDFIRAAEAVSLLRPEEIYTMGTLLLADERTDVEWKAAAMLHTECVVTLPQRAQNRIQLARRNAQHLELAKRYSQAIADPSSRSHFQKRWHLAVGYYYLGDFQSTGTTAILSSGLQSFPFDPDLLFALGSYYEAWGALRGERQAFVDAEAIYRTLAETKAPPPEIDVRLGHVLLRLGRADEAEAHLKRATLDGVESDAALAAWLLLGEVARERGQLQTSQDAFSRAWKIDPACQACAVALASAYERSAQRDAAARFVAEWLTTSPTQNRDGWWRFLLGPASRFESLRDELRTEAAR
jgi:tetratricopeptide (TPR) repeat protein